MARHADRSRGFTLIELLVVIAILSLLLAILLPSLGRAKTLARITKVHAELRGVTVALELYRSECQDQLPPTRFSCSSRTAYELPVELGPYLPLGRKNSVQVVVIEDPFHPEQSYKYRAVGTAIMNESTILENAATLWVQDGFPYGDGETGRYYSDPEESPVRYAVWSMGPDLDSPKFDIPGRMPVPGKYWLRDASDTGVITHFEDRDRYVHLSP